MRRTSKSLIVATAIAIAGMQGASAADLPIRAPLLPPPVVAPSWTGFYVGANGGAGWGTSETTAVLGPPIGAAAAALGFALPPISLNVPIASHDYNGFLGGITAGYNWQTGIFVLGVEGDFDGSSMQGNAPCVVVLNCSVKHNWVADLTARVGVVAFDRALVYVKGGGAWADGQYSIGNSVTIGGPIGVVPAGTFAVNASANGVLSGGLLGLGVEYPFLPNWSAKIEYDHIEYGKQTLNFPITTTPAVAGLPSVPVQIKDSMNMVKVGVNWRFW